MTDLRAITALVTQMLERSERPAQIEAAAELKEIVGAVLLELEEKNKRILELEGARQVCGNTLVIGGHPTADIAEVANILKDRGIVESVQIMEMPTLEQEYKLNEFIAFPEEESPKEKKPWSKNHKKSGSKFF